MKLRFFVLSILYLTCIGKSLFSQNNVTVTLEPIYSYGPFDYFDNIPSDSQIVITNNWPIAVSGKFHFFLLRNDSIKAETNMELAYNISIPSNSRYALPIKEEGFTLALTYYDALFKDNLDSGKLIFDSTYKQVARFEYQISGIDYFSNFAEQYVTELPSRPISIFSPQDNDTLADIASTVRFSWDIVSLIDASTPMYSFKLVEVLPGQSVSTAFSVNTPIVDSILVEQNYFIWKRGLDSLTIIYDSNYNYYRKYAWGVKSILQPSFNPVKFNNFSGINTISFDSLKFTYYYDGCDTPTIINKNIQKGFPFEFIEGLTTGDIDPVGVQRTPKQHYYAYKNLACPNGDFEFNSFEGWEGKTGRILLEDIILNKSGIDYDITDYEKSNHFIINSPGYDPNVPIKMIPDGGGNYSIRIGNLIEGGGVSQLSYNFVVTTETQNFRFLYALVLEDPGHDEGIQPRFIAKLEDLTTNEVISNIQISADEANPFFQKGPNKIIYRDWSCLTFDLRNRVNHNIKVTFITTDCGGEAHFGYAYVDGLCHAGDLNATPDFVIETEICYDDDLIANGALSKLENEYYWGVQKGSDQSSFRWEHGYGSAGIKDIKTMYTNLGGSWECDQYYKVYLYVKNSCSGYIFKEIQVHILPCIDAYTGGDKIICTNNYQSVNLGTLYAPGAIPVGTTFTWTPTAGLAFPNASFTSASPTVTTEYTLTVSPPNGCTTTNKITVYVLDAPDFQIISDDKLCNRKLKVQYSSNGTHTFLWSPSGETTQEITVKPKIPTTYSVTVVNQCGSLQKSILVPQLNFYDSLEYVKLIYANVIYVYGINNELELFDQSMDEGEFPAYRSVNYKMKIWSRWGTLVNTRSHPAGSMGFYNGEIKWDGRIFNNVIAQADLYNWSLDFISCSDTDGQNYKETRGRWKFWGPIPFVKRWKIDIITAFPVVVNY